MRITLLIAGAAIAGAAAAAPTTDPLSAWLYNLQLPLPDAHGTVDGVDVSLTHATCTHAQIKSLEATGSQTTISINTKDAALDCAFQWAYKTHSLKGNGRASASLVVKKANAAVAFQTSQETRPRPISSSLRNCSAAAKVTALKVKGGLTGALLDLLAPWIERKLSGEVGPALCGTLKPLVNANLTRLIRRTTALTTTCATKARRRNSNDLNAAGAASRSDLLDWQTPRVTALSKVAGRLGTCAARQGLAMNLNVSRTFRTPIGDIKIGVKDLNVRGVSDVTLAPALNNSFVVNVKGDVAVASSVTLEVTSPLSPTSLKEAFAASVSVNKATLDGTLRVALAPTKSQPFGALVRTPLQCLARSLDTVAITDIDVAAEAYVRAELAPQGTPSPLAAGPTHQSCSSGYITLGFNLALHVATAIVTIVAAAAHLQDDGASKHLTPTHREDYVSSWCIVMIAGEVLAVLLYVLWFGLVRRSFSNPLPAILGGGVFFAVFVCTLKLSYYLEIGSMGYLDPADGVTKNANAHMNTQYDGSGWAAAALYLQCFVIASIFFTPASGTYFKLSQIENSVLPVLRRTR